MSDLELDLSYFQRDVDKAMQRLEELKRNYSGGSCERAAMRAAEGRLDAAEKVLSEERRRLRRLRQ